MSVTRTQAAQAEAMKHLDEPVKVEIRPRVDDVRVGEVIVGGPKQDVRDPGVGGYQQQR